MDRERTTSRGNHRKNWINLSLPWCHLQPKGHRFVSQCRITPQRNGEIPGTTRAAVSPTGQWHELQAISGRTWREVKSTWIVPRTKLLNLLHLCPKWRSEFSGSSRSLYWEYCSLPAHSLSRRIVRVPWLGDHKFQVSLLIRKILKATPYHPFCPKLRLFVVQFLISFKTKLCDQISLYIFFTSIYPYKYIYISIFISFIYIYIQPSPTCIQLYHHEYVPP